MTRLGALLRHELLRRSILFAAPILASTVVGVFSIPVLVATVGARQWAVLVVLQSIGQFFAILVAFGWGATGPSMVAARPRHERRQFYLDSLVARGVVFVVAIPLAAVLGMLVTGQGLVNALLSAVAYAAPGIGAAWYFIGGNRPAALFFLDALPLIVGQVAGLVAVLMWPDLTAYLAGVAAFAVLGSILSAGYVLTRADDGPLSWRARRSLGSLYSSQLGGTATMVSGSIYSTLPPTLVQIVAPAVLPVYAIADRLYKYAVLALGPILQAVQSWVPETAGEQTRRRARRTLELGAAIGLVGGLCIAVLSPPVSSFLTVGEVRIPVVAAILLGLAFAAEAVAQVAGLAGLVALGGVRHLAWSSIAAAIVGLPLFAALTWWLGVVGAAAALLLVALGTAAYRAWHVIRLARLADQGHPRPAE
ncbi:hypothetical protein E4V99_01405 [Microbacterium sp. dk485]|uniref:lipopolysaccharide biosynthesis protein n=1 Tax=Microbacterium sp. dk485 TaxID=2560021 RepID=UPI0010733809|nr:hypothetical protein [Microbacterium sp. dk485]TFV83774.1 hypothetical protein E4V99_01405 [Microbacterium sp. dk485]